MLVLYVTYSRPYTLAISIPDYGVVVDNDGEMVIENNTLFMNEPKLEPIFVLQ